MLVTGIPGAGKTTFGNWLKTNLFFHHFDMEKDLRDMPDLKDKWRDGLDSGDYGAFLTQVRQLSKNIVMTWGYPEQAVHLARHGEKLGLISFWFDGDRPVSRRCWLARERIPLDYPHDCYFDHLVGQVTPSEIVEVFDQRTVSTITEAGHVDAEIIFKQHILPKLHPKDCSEF